MAETTQMTVRREEKIPTALLRGILVLLALVLTLVFYASWTDRPLEAQPPNGEIVSERVIHLQGTVAGAARILDAEGVEIMRFATGEGGFVSTIDRVIRRERLRNGVSNDGVLHVRMREGQRLSIFDPSTGREIELEAFGRDNIAKFAALVQ
ncbi:MAG: photosynthetic complex assembly protein PuhC [Pseudomonadota bacterium]